MACRLLGLHDTLPCALIYYVILQHESVVKEIEEAVRREMEAACTMLQERPQSPFSYAQARTNVVMETVRAATKTTAKKLERLATLQDQYKKKLEEANKSAEQGLNLLVDRQGSHDPKSKGGQVKESSVAIDNKFLPKGASSPIMSHKKTTGHLSGYHDEFKKYKAPFMAPEKLQIVKPLEGKVGPLVKHLLSCVARLRMM